MLKQAIAILVLAHGVAVAQPDDKASMPAGPPPPAAAAEDGFTKGTIGFAFPITLLSNITSGVVIGEPVPTVDVLYFLDAKTAFDLIVGINLHKQQIVNNAVPPMSESATAFGFAVGAGYRMYKPKAGFYTFIEPQLVLSMTDVGNSNTFGAQAALQFGVERMIVEWMSFSGAIGGGINATNKFKDIQLATQANLAVNLYWK